jgi:WD40 repeat protein
MFGKGVLIVLDAETGQQLARIDGQDDTGFASPGDLVYSPDAKKIAVIEPRGMGVEKPETRVWDLTTGQKLYALKGHTGQIHHLVFSPDSRRIATVSNSKRNFGGRPVGSGPAEVKIWDAATGHELLTLPVPTQYSHSRLGFSPDGTRLYLVGQADSSGLGQGDIEVRVWDAMPRAEK